MPWLAVLYETVVEALLYVIQQWEELIDGKLYPRTPVSHARYEGRSQLLDRLPFESRADRIVSVSTCAIQVL
jgi:hypothetical protein